MDREQILEAIGTLAKSQGAYGRLLESITEDGIQFLVEQEFTDAVDMIMFLEG